MKNTHFIKLGGLMALVGFLFLPVAGCGPMNISGMDFMKDQSFEISTKLIIGVAMLCALIMIFAPDKVLVFICSIAGLISLIIAYFVTTSKMGSGNDFGMSDAIELKSGAYVSIFGYIISAIASQSKNELLDNQIINVTVSKEVNDKQFRFCQSCGNKISDSNAKFCLQCGSLIELKIENKNKSGFLGYNDSNTRIHAETGIIQKNGTHGWFNTEERINPQTGRYQKMGNSGWQDA
jgi:hypothetical protein